MAPLRNGMDDDEVLRRVQGEFLEMPGLRLTQAQARRLWNLEQTMCESLLDTLVRERFLFRTRDGSFMKLEQAKPIKAALPPNFRIFVA
jgi:hypothetical protein